MFGKPVRIAAMLATLLVAAGCEHAMLEDTIFDREYVARHLPNEEKVLRSTTFAQSLGSAVRHRYLLNSSPPP